MTPRNPVYSSGLAQAFDVLLIERSDHSGGPQGAAREMVRSILTSTYYLCFCKITPTQMLFNQLSC